MNAAAGVYRLVLLLYPAEFRRRYRDDMVQLLLDRQRHEARRLLLVLWDELCDAARAAPRLRWEKPMNRTVILVVVGTAAIAAAVTAKITLLPVGLLAAAAWFTWGRRARPVASASTSRHGTRWMLAGLLAIAVAVAIPPVDGGELNEVWWTVMALALLSGIAMAVTVLGLATSDRAHCGLAPPQ